jgi:N-acetylglucosamine malate deacetylase 1
MKILAIGAHPDDIEIFMYGLLSVYRKQGDDIFLIIATDGGQGSAGKIPNKNLIKIRSHEAVNGLKLLGKPTFLNFADGNLAYEHNAFEIISNHIASISPDLIITHAPEDYHPDHNALSNLVTNSAGFSCPVLFCETLMGVNFNPEFYIDITEFYDQKVKAVLAHESQSPHKFVDAVNLMNRFRSAQCNFKAGNYTETYRHNKKFPFSDIRSLLPKAPLPRPYYKDLDKSMI